MRAANLVCLVGSLVLTCAAGAYGGEDREPSPQLRDAFAHVKVVRVEMRGQAARQPRLRELTEQVLHAVGFEIAPPNGKDVQCVVRLDAGFEEEQIAIYSLSSRPPDVFSHSLDAKGRLTIEFRPGGS